MSKDLYEILGVSKNATADELKRAYRKLSMAYHPDRQNGKSEKEKKDAEEKFKEVNSAYSVLSDKDKRAQYDQFGTTDDMQGNPFGGGSGFDPFDFFRSHFSGGFDDDFGGFNPFGHFGHQTHSNNSQPPDYDNPEDGQDIRISMTIPFNVVLNGTEHKFDLDLDEECPTCHGSGIEAGSKPEKCPHCDGKGRIVHVERRGMMVMQNISDCPYCNGTGWSVKKCKSCHGSKRKHAKKTITVKIPSGIDNGQSLRVAGSGQCGVKGGKNGDLYIRISVEDNNVYKRNGLDLISKLHLNPITATLGGKQKISTPYEEKEIIIPKGIAADKVLKIEKCGIRSKNKTGDLYLEVKIEPLVNLNKEQMKILENLNASLNSKKNVHLFESFENKIKSLRKN